MASWPTTWSRSAPSPADEPKAKIINGPAAPRTVHCTAIYREPPIYFRSKCASSSSDAEQRGGDMA